MAWTAFTREEEGGRLAWEEKGGEEEGTERHTNPQSLGTGN